VSSLRLSTVCLYEDVGLNQKVIKFVVSSLLSEKVSVHVQTELKKLFLYNFYLTKHYSYVTLIIQNVESGHAVNFCTSISVLHFCTSTIDMIVIK